MTNTSTRFRAIRVSSFKEADYDSIGVLDTKLHKVALFSRHSEDDNLSDVIATMEAGDLDWNWSDGADVDYKEMS